MPLKIVLFTIRTNHTLFSKQGILKGIHRSANLALALAIALFMNLLLVTDIRAESIAVTNANLQPDPENDGGWVLSADFDIALTPRVEEAVSHGITLYFVIDFELIRPRWYWWDDHVATTSQIWRLSYHALTRQYRLSLEGLQLHFNSLEDALRSLTHVRNWRVLDKDSVLPGKTYQAQVRIRLDTTLLAKPLQLSAITSSDWNLASEWKYFDFIPSPTLKTDLPK